MMLIRSLFLINLVVAAALPAEAQEKVLIYGHIRDLVSDGPITDATITIDRSDGMQRTMVVDEDANYEVELGYDSVFDIRITAPEKITKRFVVDLRNVPPSEQEGGHGMKVDMSLFTPVAGKDYTFLSEPMGRARYQVADSNIVWDSAYTAHMRKKLDAVLPTVAAPPVTVPAGNDEAQEPEGRSALLIALVLVLLAIAGLIVYLRRRG